MSKRDQSNFTEARQSKVIRPQKAPFGKKFDPWISSFSPTWQRCAVVQLTRYLAMETGYRMDLDETVATWRKVEVNAFAVTELVVDKNGNEYEALVGNAIFYTLSGVATLYYCYLHPFFRNRKLFQKHWGMISRRYPQFDVEPPISKPMQALLTRVGCQITNGRVVGKMKQGSF